MTLLRINSKEELRKFANDNHLRYDWHEPDEQDISAEVFGRSFDNAGFWGMNSNVTDFIKEFYVVLFKLDQGERIPVAEVNLATLFSMACE
jgi:hypothetical protein